MHAEQGSGCNKLDYTQLLEYSYIYNTDTFTQTYITPTHIHAYRAREWVQDFFNPAPLNDVSVFETTIR
jgi:hypothetical protein